ncbi:hypothetical protein RCL1_000027 [Eukaryota sp. TZLM3-RCL]
MLISLLIKALVRMDTSVQPLFYGYFVVLGVAACCLLWSFFSWLFPKISTAYSKHFKPIQRADMLARGVACVHAYFLFFLAIYMLWFDPERALLNDHGNGYPKSSPLLGLSTGYFIFDLLVMFIHGKPVFSYAFLLHHSLCIIGWTTLVLTRNGLFFPVFQSLCEFTNIFVSLHWFYCNAPGWKTSKAFIFNGLCLLVTFTIFRESLLVYSIYLVYTDFPFSYLLPFNKVFLLISSVLLNGLNLYWYSKIVRGLVRKFSKPKNQ